MHGPFKIGESHESNTDYSMADRGEGSGGPPLLLQACRAESPRYVCQNYFRGHSPLTTLTRGYRGAIDQSCGCDT